MTNKTCPNSI